VCVCVNARCCNVEFHYNLDELQDHVLQPVGGFALEIKSNTCL
jgi:hypothetical protein